MDSFNALFFGPLLLGAAAGLTAGFILGITYWRKKVAWANEAIRPPYKS